MSHVFEAELAAYTASNVFDGVTTARNTHRGLEEADFPRGSSFILGIRWLGDTSPFMEGFEVVTACCRV